MNRRLILIVAGVAAAAVVSVSGAAHAWAPSDPTARQAGSVTATATPTTHDAAKYLRYLHDKLGTAAHAGDASAAYHVVTKLRPVLKGVQQAPVERAALDLSSRADGQAAELERDLPGLDLLAPVSALVTSLLSTVMDLVTSLLGGLPVPLPDLPLPDLPVPLPDLPVPPGDEPAPPEDAPAPPEDAPAPPEDAPAPPEDAPAPEEPPADEPAPPEDAPMPELPELPELPDAPLPDAPLP
jgi:hypothetical protein